MSGRAGGSAELARRRRRPIARAAAASSACPPRSRRSRIAEPSAAVRQPQPTPRSAGPGDRRDLPDRAGRRLGSGLGVARGHAVRHRLRGQRQPARRHRQQGQDLPARRRPVSADARRPRQRAAGDDAPARARRADAVRDVESRARCCGCRPRARSAAPTPPTSATRRRWPRGARSSGSAQTPAGTRVEISTRSGNTRTPDETWSDWSAAYTDQRGQRRSRARARATCSGARCSPAPRGESPLLTSVTAAYLPRNMRPRVTSITIHPPGTVFQRPFPTDPEIAGFDGDLPDRRARRQRSGAAARRTSGAAPTRRGC